MTGNAVATGLREAELFAVAEVVLVEVLGRIGPEDRGILLPTIPDLPCPPGDSTLWSIVQRYVDDEAQVPGRLAGGGSPPPGPRPDVAHVASLATAAALAVTDGSAQVRAPYGTVSARQYLLRLTVTRSLLAHYVAAYLGSTACPLPEELARPLLELTAPHADRWRSTGIFRPALPVPPLASWRDRFLLTAGHLPHPLGH